MKRNSLALVLFALVLGLPARAETTSACPDLSQAKQVANCPSEDELMRLFRSTCGVENAPDAENPELCDSKAEFRRRKNLALWESTDGEFMGYVACSVPPEQIKSKKLVSLGLAKRAGLTKIICTYGGGIQFTLRTRETCTVPGALPTKKGVAADCSVKPDTCKVACK